jgi:hypothetical protein
MPFHPEPALAEYSVALRTSSVSPSHDRLGELCRPASAGQGLRSARPAPPAYGFDGLPTSRFFAAKRSWLAACDSIRASVEMKRPGSTRKSLRLELFVQADRLRSCREPDHDWLVHGAKVLTKRCRTKGQGNEARSFVTPCTCGADASRGRARLSHCDEAIFTWGTLFTPDF